MCNSIGNLAHEFHSASSSTGLLHQGYPRLNDQQCDESRVNIGHLSRAHRASMNAFLAREPNASTNDCLTTLFFLSWRSVTRAYLSSRAREYDRLSDRRENPLFPHAFPLLQFNCGLRYCCIAEQTLHNRNEDDAGKKDTQEGSVRSLLIKFLIYFNYIYPQL